MPTTHDDPGRTAARWPTNRPLDDSYAEQLWSALQLTGSPSRKPAHSLPIPRLYAAQRRSTMHYAVTAIDISGRIADRSPLAALRWQAGLSIVISIAGDALLVTPHGSGEHRITRQGHLRLPAPIRHLIHLMPGDRLLVAACPDRDLLLAYPMTAVDTMLMAHHRAVRPTS